MKDIKNTKIGNGVGMLRVAEAAELLGVNPKTVYRKVDDGSLPHYRFGNTIFLKVDEIIGSMKRVAAREEILG